MCSVNCSDFVDTCAGIMPLVFIPDNAGKLNSYHVVVQETKVQIRSCYECSHTVSLREDIMHVRHFVLAVRFVSFRLDNAVQVFPRTSETNDSHDPGGTLKWFQYTRDL